MGSITIFGTVLVIIGLFLLIVLPIFGILAGELLILVSVLGGWIITLIGAIIILVSLIFERMSDLKKEKFNKNY